MKIAWGITGAGHLLLESVKTLELLSEEHEVTVLLSAAGEEVLKMYGLYSRIESITGGYYQELVLEKDQKFSYPIAGRFSLGRYDLLIVSPSTSNTIAKAVQGIADTLITNIIAQAGKGKTRTLIVPVDQEAGEVQTVLPSKLELELCQHCSTCQAAAACSQDAITPGIEINLLKCQGCGACQAACPFGAVSGGKKIFIRMREIDVLNTQKLDVLEDVDVVETPGELLSIISSF